VNLIGIQTYKILKVILHYEILEVIYVITVCNTMNIENL